jgi:G:T/U-mismatch repair DNA glycosylase
MFIHKHPYEPFLPDGCTRLIVGTLPPPRFSVGKLKSGDVDFCYGSKDGLLWKILDRIYGLNLDYENTARAIEQRKNFLADQKIGIYDIISSCERVKMDASDLGMSSIEVRNMVALLKQLSEINMLLLTGGNSKNGPEYHLRRHLKSHGIALQSVDRNTPRIHQFHLTEDRIIKTVSLTAPTGTANIAIGSNPEYKWLKQKNPEFNTFDFRVRQYRRFLHEDFS